MAYGPVEQNEPLYSRYPRTRSAMTCCPLLGSRHAGAQGTKFLRFESDPSETKKKLKPTKVRPKETQNTRMTTKNQSTN